MKHYRDMLGLKFINAAIEFVLVLISYFISGGIRYYLGVGIISPFAARDLVDFLPFVMLCGIIDCLIYGFIGDYSTIRVRSIKREFVRILFVQILGGLFSAAFN